jgi:NAD(P)-dependent dehydrogenase (short-subunit alcohol dehydrogenase family)
VPASEIPRRNLVLTGASRGIGHATVKLFRERGWRVITLSRKAFDARCAWEEGADDHIQVDLGEPRSLAFALGDLKNRLNGAPLHALVNNAGISPKGPNGERLSSLTTPVEAWINVFHVNFVAPILLVRGLIDALAAGRGAIVNITSIAGNKVHPYAGSAYATSKAALSALTREMANDCAPYDVRVNAVSPGEIKTEILSPGSEARFAPLIPMKRLGSPEEVAQLVYFLCSPQASYVTGEEIQINGGQHI